MSFTYKPLPIVPIFANATMISARSDTWGPHSVASMMVGSDVYSPTAAYMTSAITPPMNTNSGAMNPYAALVDQYAERSERHRRGST